MKTQQHGHRWTEEELRRLISMWLEGSEHEEIQKEFNCSRAAITKIVLRLRRDGVPLPRKIAGHKAGRANKPWTQSEVEFLVRRRNESISAEQIAVELDRSFFAVQGMIGTLRKHGVRVRMLGSGVRKLWNAESLKGAIAGRGLLDEDEVAESNIRLVA
jgi:biotin operon repressor